MQNWKNINKVVVKGSTYCGYYETLEEACIKTGWYLISRMDKKPIWLEDYRVAFYSEGLCIPIWKVKEVARLLGLDCYPRRKQFNKFTFRSGPVKWTGKGRSYSRQIAHTFQERRENDFIDYDEDAIEYKIKSRPSRRSHVLPSSWDDRSRRDYKSWKFHRKTQYKDIL